MHDTEAIPRRRFICALALPFLAGFASTGGTSKWKEYVLLYNDSKALREFAELMNAINAGAFRLATYESGKVLAAGDDKKQLIDEMLVDYNRLEVLLSGVKGELEAEREALRKL